MSFRSLIGTPNSEETFQIECENITIHIKLRLGELGVPRQQSQKQNISIRKEDQILTKPFKSIGKLRYWGTRIGLEQNALKVWIYGNQSFPAQHSSQIR